MKNVLLPFLFVIAISSAEGGGLYRWIGPDGKVNYGDVPAADATEVEHIKVSGNQEAGDDLPYEARKAHENFPVTLYVSDTCAQLCTQARTLLMNRGIPYKESLLRTREDLEALKVASGIEGYVPVLAVGRDYLKGFSELQWNTALDMAGYPKTPGYRQRVMHSRDDVSGGSAAVEGDAQSGRVIPAEPVTR
jgi:hypothetical protein